MAKPHRSISKLLNPFSTDQLLSSRGSRSARFTTCSHFARSASSAAASRRDEAYQVTTNCSQSAEEIIERHSFRVIRLMLTIVCLPRLLSGPKEERCQGASGSAAFDHHLHIWREMAGAMELRLHFHAEGASAGWPCRRRAQGFGSFGQTCHSEGKRIAELCLRDIILLCSTKS